MSINRIAVCCFVFGWLLAGDPAWGEDYWTDCDTAYAFCTRRPYHRDCSIWTHWGQPLSVTRWHITTNPAAETDFCKANRWHMSCGQRVQEERYRETCPKPELIQ